NVLLENKRATLTEKKERQTDRTKKQRQSDLITMPRGRQTRRKTIVSSSDTDSPQEDVVMDDSETVSATHKRKLVSINQSQHRAAKKALVDPTENQIEITSKKFAENDNISDDKG
uniref:Uncharacterized protein n=1 Tax=Clytia hemisphaerica TaxID=252671 RepID=A0A7M5X614_9CNID